MEYRGAKVVGPPTIKIKKKKRKYCVVPYEELSRTQKILRIICNAIVFIVEKSFNFAFSFWLPPAYYIFFMFLIRRPMVADCGIMRDLIEIPITLFGLININGNFLKHRYLDVSLKTYAKKNHCPEKSCMDESEAKDNYCDRCNLYQVENSWHCQICNQCVVGRDYHCFVFSRCITRHNKRYHILGLFYTLCGLIFISVYALRYNCRGDELITIYHVPVVGKLLFNIIWGIHVEFDLDLYACWLPSFILLINIPLFVVTFPVLLSNVNYVVRRTTYWESKKGVRNAERWTDHVFEIKRFWLPLAVEVFGERWYLAVLSPFVSSPLPKLKRM